MIYYFIIIVYLYLIYILIINIFNIKIFQEIHKLAVQSYSYGLPWSGDRAYAMRPERW